MKIWETFITIGSTFRTSSSKSVQQDKKRGYKLELNESVRAAHTSDLETCLIIRCPLDFSLRVPEKLAGCSRRGSLNLARWVSQQCVALRMSGTHFVHGAKLHKCPRTASTCSVIWREERLFNLSKWLLCGSFSIATRSRDISILFVEIQDGLLVVSGHWLRFDRAALATCELHRLTQQLSCFLIGRSRL